MGQNGRMETSGKHAGKRRAEAAPRPEGVGSGRAGGSAGGLLVLALGVTLAVVAWGYLVYAAIDFGTTARGGESRAWWFLALASVGAVACLFVGLMLVARLIRTLGRRKETDTPPPPPRPIGGKRAAR
jgi:hypothetical protein